MNYSINDKTEAFWRQRTPYFLLLPFDLISRPIGSKMLLRVWLKPTTSANGVKTVNKKKQLRENLRQRLKLNSVRKIYVSATSTDCVTLMVSSLFTLHNIMCGLARDNSEVVNSPI